MFFSRSGSSAEGLDDLVIGKEGTSDFDIMLEFAGLRWAVDAGAETEPDVISPEAAHQLWAKPTDNPGFVTLHWVRTSRCEHEAPLAALPADAVRKLMFASCRALFYPEFSTAGPAVNVRPPRATDGGVDYVPCLRLPWWPEKEAFLGHHPVTDFPPAATRRDICRFGVHMVPTGRTGSDTEQSEWRLSFSRAEVYSRPPPEHDPTCNHYHRQGVEEHLERERRRASTQVIFYQDGGALAGTGRDI